ncbi:ATP-binding cassette domain-containing protein [Anaerolineales bacterium HSG24]|nr:ATP-binding cassette domain-containing protein [Anaerolineales bacterium HSG24]
MFFNHTFNLEQLAWPVSRLDEAVEALGHQAGYVAQNDSAPVIPNYLDKTGRILFEHWLPGIADIFGLESEPIEAPYAEVESLLRGAGPAILRLPSNYDQDGETRFLVLLSSSWRRILLLTPELKKNRVSVKSLQTILCEPYETPVLAQLEQLMVEANIPEERWTRVRQSILREQLSEVRIKGCWLLRLPPNANLWFQVKKSKLHHYLGILIGVNLVTQLISLASWWIIGWGALQGHFEWSWLFAWALILLTSIPFSISLTWLQALLAIGAGAIFKKRLLHGTLQLEPEEIRHQGAGQFLGRVMEAEAVELMALGGGFMAFMALIELVLAMSVLAMGAGGLLHAFSLFSWALFTVLLGWRYFSQTHSWVSTYRHMTNELVEHMVGHRTRLAQEEPHRWHDSEDEILTRYFKLSERLDQVGIQLGTVIPRGWLISGFSGVAYTFIVYPNSPMSIAISLGGVMLASQALTRLVGGVNSVVGFMVAWGQVKPLFEASKRANEQQSSVSLPTLIARTQADVDHGQTIIETRDIIFRYPKRTEPVLNRCHLQIRKGDRILLEGPSGGGKSTLATILVGLRVPQSGLLLLRGLDQQTLGITRWRDYVVSAPQFHENHVLSETFAFNLLMGRNWPPPQEDLIEAETVCRELGLGELIDRMPSGLQQMVGESGWQLSHGERSRLFIARALLQHTDLIVLDESFASLDPENLQQAMQCVLNRATTLMVIAHP